MKTKKEVKVIQPEEPIAVEIMAQAIVDISNAMKKLSNSRLKREVIVILLKDKTGWSKHSIETMLDTLENLEKLFLKPSK